MIDPITMLRKGHAFRAKRGVGTLCLLLMSASCVPAASGTAVPVAPSDFAVANDAPPTILPPPPEPLALQPLAPDEAVAMNAAIPIAAGDNPAARAFRLRAASAIDRMRSLECLTAAVYYEAASESEEGQRAVAQVVLNRVRHPTFPNSVCGVVYQGSERSSGCQFSFTCDGSLMRTPSAAAWASARRIAAAALAGSVYAPVGHATHYHTQQVLPYWASSLLKSAVIGAHVFYRWNGGWGKPSAFKQVYAGREPLPAPKPSQQPAPALFSDKAVRAELAAILQASSQLEAPPARVAAGTPLPHHRIAEAKPTGPRLPDSQVLEAHRYSGVPRDELPAHLTSK